MFISLLAPKGAAVKTGSLDSMAPSNSAFGLPHKRYVHGGGCTGKNFFPLPGQAQGPAPTFFLASFPVTMPFVRHRCKRVFKTKKRDKSVMPTVMRHPVFFCGGREKGLCCPLYLFVFRSKLLQQSHGFSVLRDCSVGSQEQHSLGAGLSDQ